MAARTRIILLVASMALLQSCQYASFFRTNTKEYPMSGQDNSDEACMAMGTMKGDSSYDRCVEAEEVARGHEMRYFPVPPKVADEYF